MTAGKGVATVSIANEALKAVVRGRLMSDYRIAASAIDVSCSEGNVRLVGLADSAEQIKLAITLTSGLIGVRNVRNELVVRGPTGSKGVSQSA